jgi:hypothetical protein
MRHPAQYCKIRIKSLSLPTLNQVVYETQQTYYKSMLCDNEIISKSSNILSIIFKTEIGTSDNISRRLRRSRHCRDSSCV